MQPTPSIHVPTGAPTPIQPGTSRPAPATTPPSTPIATPTTTIPSPVPTTTLGIPAIDPIAILALSAVALLISIAVLIWSRSSIRREAIARAKPFKAICVGCGYPLGDLPEEARCPECGVPVRESHPDRLLGPEPVTYGGRLQRGLAILALGSASAWIAFLATQVFTANFVVRSLALGGIIGGLAASFIGWALLSAPEPDLVHPSSVPRRARIALLATLAKAAILAVVGVLIVTGQKDSCAALMAGLGMVILIIVQGLAATFAVAAIDARVTPPTHLPARLLIIPWVWTLAFLWIGSPAIAFGWASFIAYLVVVSWRVHQYRARFRDSSAMLAACVSPAQPADMR